MRSRTRCGNAHAITRGSTLHHGSYCASCLPALRDAQRNAHTSSGHAQATVQRQHQCVRVGQVTTGTARGKPNAPKNIIPLMIRVANAPCSWGVLEFDSSTRSAPFAQVLDEIRATGYAGTELGDWGFLPTDPQRLRAELAARELSLVGAFVPVALANRDTHAAGVDTAVRTARLMRDADAPDSFIVLSDNNGAVPVREQHAGRIPASLSLTPAEWRT